MFWGAYQLVDDFEWQTEIKCYRVDTWYGALDTDGILTGRYPFAWDGPTGALKTKDFIAGSCIHDILCQFVDDGHLPQYLQCVVDGEMYRVNARQKMWRLRREWTYAAVRIYQQQKRAARKKKIMELKL